MGRSPCCSKEGLKRGAWTVIEDKILTDYIKLHGEGKWRNVPKKAGLERCGKSCRLRWLNYLRPDIKRGNISPDEEDLIIRLHKLLGNRWSLIAGRLPGRTDNEIKNYWNTILAKKVVKDDHQQQPNLKNREEVTPNTASPSSSSKKEQSSQVIRTKAFKYAKVFNNPSQPFNLDDDHRYNALKRPSMDDNNSNGPTDDKSAKEFDNNMLFGCEETYYRMDDFDMGELCFSDILSSGFLTSYDDHLINCDNNNNYLLASSDGHPQWMIIDEIMKDWTNVGDTNIVDGNNSHSFK